MSYIIGYVSLVFLIIQMIALLISFAWSGRLICLIDRHSLRNDIGYFLYKWIEILERKTRRQLENVWHFIWIPTDRFVRNIRISIAHCKHIYLILKKIIYFSRLFYFQTFKHKCLSYAFITNKILKLAFD